MKQFKTLYSCNVPCVILQTLGGSGVYLKPTERSHGSPGQVIMSLILREHTMTPCPTPSQAYREGSELVTVEEGTQELYFFSFKGKSKDPSLGIRLEGHTPTGTLFSALFISSLKSHESLRLLQL